MLGTILAQFSSIALSPRAYDDDSIDQLNHWATSSILVGLAIFTGAKQYVGDPIHCWVPAEYKKKHFQKYSDSFCWIHPMYNIPFDDPIPFKAEERWYNDISFYRWVTIVFLIQALLFKLPNIIWEQMKIFSGLNVTKIVQMCMDTSMLTQEKRDEKMGHVAIFIDRWLRTYTIHKYGAINRFRDKFAGIVFCIGKHQGTYLTGLYVFVKLLYFANSIGQFFLLSAFLDMDFWGFGFRAMKELNRAGRWQDHYYFPRIGLCDYKIRQLQNIQTFSVQCVLSINLFLEKMYLIIWFWMMVVFAANCINLIKWLIRGFTPSYGPKFIGKYLTLLNIERKREKTLFNKFVNTYLRRDGVFMLRIVASNTSEILTLDLVKQLWTRFKVNTHSHDDDKPIYTGNGRPDAPAALNPKDEGGGGQ